MGACPCIFGSLSSSHRFRAARSVDNTVHPPHQSVNIRSIVLPTSKDVKDHSNIRNLLKFLTFSVKSSMNSANVAKVIHRDTRSFHDLFEC